MFNRVFVYITSINDCHKLKALEERYLFPVILSAVEEQKKR